MRPATTLIVRLFIGSIVLLNRNACTTKARSLARLQEIEPPTLRSEEGCSDCYQLLRDNASLVLKRLALFAHVTKAQMICAMDTVDTFSKISDNIEAGAFSQCLCLWTKS